MFDMMEATPAWGAPREMEAEKMRRFWLVGLLVLAGCQNIVGPFQPRAPVRVDEPGVPIDKQEKRIRERLALPDDSSGIAPRSGAVRPGASPRY